MSIKNLEKEFDPGVKLSKKNSPDFHCNHGEKKTSSSVKRLTKKKQTFVLREKAWHNWHICTWSHIHLNLSHYLLKIQKNNASRLPRYLNNSIYFQLPNFMYILD